MMSKDKVKVNMEEHIKALFSGQSELEFCMTDKITGLIEKFYGASEVTSQTNMDKLAYFADSICIPDAPVGHSEYIESYVEEIIQHAINTTSPNFIGHMTSALPYFTRPLSNMLVTLNQNVVKAETSKYFTLQERQVIAMLHNLVYENNHSFYQEHCQNEQSTLGIVTSGGTMANLTALWIARNKKLSYLGFNVVKEGLANALIKGGYRRGVIIASTLIHYSIEKAVDVLGLGSDNLIKIGVDEKGRMDVRQLQRTIQNCKENGDLIFAIIGIGGATETGSIDSLEEIGQASHENDIHFHVDAAWGGPLLMSDKYRYMLEGIKTADTVTIDGHKQLYLPVGIGILLCKDPYAAKHIEKQAPYIIRENSCDLGRRTLDGSRPAMSFLLHAALHLIGRNGYAYLIDEGMRKARYMAELISKNPAFELIGEPEINILNYRYIPGFCRDKDGSGGFRQEYSDIINEINKDIQNIQSQNGHSFVSRTNLNCYKKYQYPVTVLRAILVNPLTTEKNIQDILDTQIKIGTELEKPFLINKKF